MQNTLKNIPVNLEVAVSREESYPIHSGWDLSDIIHEVLTKDNVNTEKALVVIDSGVDKLHHQTYNDMFEPVFDKIEWFVMPSGETEKNIDNWKAIVDFALDNSVKRNTPLLSIGGGVTGDIAGFAAATILRGLPLYHFPTTLLAMVDSSVGGKTGINHKHGKNLIGAFYQPKAVFVETRLLETLPQKEWLCGLGEVLKYAALDKPELLMDIKGLLSDWHNYSGLNECIVKCISIKADIVKKDEMEGGIRAFLNLGHTFAHALEAYTEYKIFSHGEAVFIGLVAAMHLSKELGNDVDPNTLIKFKGAYGLHVEKYISAIEDIMVFMFKDKKNLNNKIRLVLLELLGKPYITDTCSLEQIRGSWEYALRNVNT